MSTIVKPRLVHRQAACSVPYKQKRRNVLIGCALIAVTAGAGTAVAQPGRQASIAEKARGALILQRILNGKTPVTIPEYLVISDPSGAVATYQLVVRQLLQKTASSRRLSPTTGVAALPATSRRMVGL